MVVPHLNFYISLWHKLEMYNYNSDYSTRKIIQLLHQLQKVGKKTSQVTYVTMVPRMRNETLRPQ